MHGVFTLGQNALVRGWWKKVTDAYPKARNFKDMKVPVIDKGVFGISLVDSIQYARSSISYIDDLSGIQCFGCIPTIIAKCGSFLKEEALRTEGIFRVSGSAKRIRTLQSIFDTPDGYGSQLDWQGYTVHDAANVMKRFLNFLPEPVVTFEYYHIFKDTALAEYQDMNQKIQAIQCTIERLPTAHQFLLLYLLDMLGMFGSAREFTRMDSDCLAAVFAPGILSHPNDEMNPAGYSGSQKVLSFLIDNQERFSMPRANAIDTTFGATIPTILPLLSSAIESNCVHGIRSQRQSAEKTCPSTNEHLHVSTISSIATTPYFGSGTETLAAMEFGERIHREVTLRRCKTAPTIRRNKFGSHEPQQIIHVNRASSQRGGRHDVHKVSKTSLKTFD